ncbi:MAG: hypothetical protein ABL914_12615 [Novosphingobium sp.]|uniref:helix-turn-helix transcriptional regulator n=1 Tax=Novosphingobium sp. TaxID=1874826 RepID=UPI0032BCF270
MNSVDRLSENQVEALIRSLLGQTSKSIAKQMSDGEKCISPHTVDSWMRKSIVTLGVSSRDEAANLVSRSPRAGEYQSLISQSSPIVADFLQATPLSSRTGSASSGAIWGWPFPTKGRPENDDTLAWRVLWPILIAIGTIFAFSALYAVLRGWSEMASG